MQQILEENLVKLLFWDAPSRVLASNPQFLNRNRLKSIKFIIGLKMYLLFDWVLVLTGTFIIWESITLCTIQVVSSSPLQPPVPMRFLPKFHSKSILNNSSIKDSFDQNDAGESDRELANSRQSHVKPLNITADLLSHVQLSDSSFWFCLDKHVTDAPVADNSRRVCNCYLSTDCSVSRPDHTSSPSVLSIWLRCYQVNTPESLKKLHLIMDQLFTRFRLTTILKQESVHQCDNVAWSKWPVQVRTDFVQSELQIKPILHLLEVLVTKPLEIDVHLVQVTIRQSQLTTVPLFLLTKASHLVSLNLTQNKIEQFDPFRITSFINDNLVTLDLSHNQLTSVNTSKLTALRHINLSDNNLTTIAKDIFPESIVKNIDSVMSGDINFDYDLGLSRNPWNCNHNLSWLIDFISILAETNVAMFESNIKNKMFQSNEPECSLPQSARMFPFSVWKSNQNVTICEKCECYLKDKYAKAGYRYITVNCTNKGLTELPEELPKNVKIIDLSNNQIGNLKALRKENARAHWRNIHTAILANNSIDSVKGIEELKSIVYLDLSGNLLTELPLYLLDEMLVTNNIDKLAIGYNPYNCDCDTYRMQQWIQKNYRFLLDLNNVRCGQLRPALIDKYSSQYNTNQYFMNREITMIQRRFLCPDMTKSWQYLDFVNVLLALLITLIVIKTVYDYYWQKRTGKLPRFFKINI